MLAPERYPAPRIPESCSVKNGILHRQFRNPAPELRNRQSIFLWTDLRTWKCQNQQYKHQKHRGSPCMKREQGRSSVLFNAGIHFVITYDAG